MLPNWPLEVADRITEICGHLSARQLAFIISELRLGRVLFIRSDPADCQILLVIPKPSFQVEPRS